MNASIPNASIPNVILVHGAWADGSTWSKVIPLLARNGLTATAVQLPLTGFEADVAAVQRAIALAEGEVVLVGHSYAGAVIGEAGNDPKVARMVYIDQENKRLGRKQTIGETLPLTIVALLIAMPFVWKHREEITIAPLIGLGVGYSALLLLKLIGRATIVAARTMAQEVALSLSDTPVPRKRDADPDDQRRIENAMARLHEIDHDDGGGKAP